MARQATALVPVLLLVLLGRSCAKGRSYGDVVGDVVGVYGYIGHGNFLDPLEPGAVVSGRHPGVFVEAPPEECFPRGSVERSSRDVRLGMAHRHVFQNGLGLHNSLQHIQEYVYT